MSSKNYNIEQCMKAVGGSLPAEMKKKIGPRQIMVIICSYYEYLTLSAVVENRRNLNLSTTDTNPCEAEAFIAEKCLERGFLFSLKEVQCVLNGEFQYMCSEAIIDLDPEHASQNLEKEV